MYLGIQSMGLVINEVQRVVGQFGAGTHTFGEIAGAGLFGPTLFLLLVFLANFLLDPVNWYYRNKWSQKLRFANQREINDHRATLDVARIKSREYDDLERRIQELPTSWQTRIWFSEELFNLFVILVSFVMFGTALVWYQPLYALILIITGIPLMVVEFRLVSMWWNLFQDLVPTHKKRNVLERPYRDAVAFVQSKMFDQMSPLRKEIDINVGGVLDAYQRIRKISIRNKLFAHLFAVAGLSGVVVYAIWSTVAHGGEIGTFTIIVAAAKTFQGNLEAIVATIAEQWNSAKGVILIEKDYLGMQPVLKTEYPVVPDFRRTPCIRFDDVHFSYPNSDQEVLKGVSFAIEPGKKIAIVGKSGNGKSTILSLLLRHYDPTLGSVFAGDVNLRNIEPGVWSRVVCAQTQEYVVLARPVGEEIASSCMTDAVDLDRVRRSCEFASFAEVVEEDPRGYDAQIGTEFGGREFSGGERQRLALARVRYRGTPVLILDEPDSDLDPESANRVIDAVFALQGVTVVLVTHHVSRAERCDKIIVMGKGRVVEQGTHEELMALGGVYVSLREKDRERLGAESPS
jgi:ATP-binding cassette subfamily B protein